MGEENRAVVEMSEPCQCVMFEEDPDINYDLPVCECGHVSDEHDEDGCWIGS